MRQLSIIYANNKSVHVTFENTLQNDIQHGNIYLNSVIHNVKKHDNTYLSNI